MTAITMSRPLDQPQIAMLGCGHVPETVPLSSSQADLHEMDTKTFHPFPRLPTELRLTIIINLAIERAMNTHCRRYITYFYYRCVQESSHWTFDPFLGREVDVLRRYEVLSPVCLGSLLATNTLLRSEVLGYLKKRLGRGGRRGPWDMTVSGLNDWKTLLVRTYDLDAAGQRVRENEESETVVMKWRTAVYYIEL